MPASAKVQAATLERFIEGWRSWVPQNILAAMSEDCVQITLPFRSGTANRKRKEELKKLFPILMSTLTNFELTIHNIVHDPAQNKAAIYAITKGDTPFMPYHNEQSVFVWFDKSGENIEKVEEMFDAAFMDEFLPKFHQYMSEKMQA